MQDVVKSLVFLTGNEPGFDRVALAGELIDMEANRVVEPTTETVPVFGSNRSQPGVVDWFHSPIKPGPGIAPGSLDGPVARLSVTNVRAETE